MGFGQPLHAASSSAFWLKEGKRGHTVCVPSVCWAMEEWESSSTSSALAPPQLFQLNCCAKLLAVHCWGGAGGITHMSSAQGSRAVLHQKYTFLSLISIEFGVEWVHGVHDISSGAWTGSWALRGAFSIPDPRIDV